MDDNKFNSNETETYQVEVRMIESETKYCNNTSRNTTNKSNVAVNETKTTIQI